MLRFAPDEVLNSIVIWGLTDWHRRACLIYRNVRRLMGWTPPDGIYVPR